MGAAAGGRAGGRAGASSPSASMCALISRSPIIDASATSSALRALLKSTARCVWYEPLDSRRRKTPHGSRRVGRSSRGDGAAAAAAAAAAETAAAAASPSGLFAQSPAASARASTMLRNLGSAIRPNSGSRCTRPACAATSCEACPRGSVAEEIRPARRSSARRCRVHAWCLKRTAVDGFADAGAISSDEIHDDAEARAPPLSAPLCTALALSAAPQLLRTTAGARAAIFLADDAGLGAFMPEESQRLTPTPSPPRRCRCSAWRPTTTCPRRR